MKKLVSLLIMDSRLAFRYGLIYAALFVCLVYIGVFMPLSTTLRSMFLPFIIYIDLAIFGFYFLGAWIFFERQEDTLNALMLTPIKFTHYIWSKVLVLSMISVLVSLLLAFLLIPGFSLVSSLLLTLSIALNSILFCMVGLWSVLRYSSFSHYLPSSIFLLFFFHLPAFDYFNLITSNSFGKLLWLLHPSYSCMKLISSSFECCLISVDYFSILLYTVLTVLWIIIIQRFAFRAFRYYILEERSPA
jgi:fluoroquinolone transport system permease protein